MEQNTKGNSEDVECCANCTHLISFPRGNRYGDIDHLCVVTGYFTMSIYKDRRKVRHFTPGGRELKCQYQRREAGKERKG